MTDKGRILTFPDTAAIEAEAAAWVARFDAGDISAKDQAAFQEWLNRGALYREAIAVYGNLWSEFDALKPLAAGGDAGPVAIVRDNRPAAVEKAMPWLAACAAAVVALMGGAVLLRPQPVVLAKVEQHSPASSASPARSFYETPVGGQKKITLADGTSVMLNTNSRLDVDFSGARRDVHLVRGEAFFEVVHDKARPFTVYADNYVVRDIGTAFDVHLAKPGLVEVGVTRGSVEVAPANGRHALGAVKGPSVLTAGQNIVLGEKIERAEMVSSNDMGRRLAWRQGQLIYSGQPLGEVLDDVSRYSDIKIELADPALASLPVIGSFRTDQVEAIFAALEQNFGVHAEWVDPQYVRFTSAGAKPASRD